MIQEYKGGTRNQTEAGRDILGKEKNTCKGMELYEYK